MSTYDKFGLLYLYVMMGIVTVAGATAMGDIPTSDGDWNKDSVGPIIAVFIAWPIFLVKYLAIGIWFVLVSGYHTLV